MLSLPCLVCVDVNVELGNPVMSWFLKRCHVLDTVKCFDYFFDA